jgi:hypothetical protein
MTIGVEGAIMRVVSGLALAVLALLVPSGPAAAGYGEDLCTKFISGAPVDCTCAGPVIEQEYTEEEAEVVLEVLGIMASADPKKDDMASLEAKFRPIEQRVGKAKLDELGKRYEKIGVEQKCPKK